MRQISILNTGDKLSRELFGNITLAPKELINYKFMEETLIEVAELHNSQNSSVCKLVDMLRFPLSDWYTVIDVAWRVYNVSAVTIANNPSVMPIWEGKIADLCGLNSSEDKSHTTIYDKLGSISMETELAVYVYQKQ